MMTSEIFVTVIMPTYNTEEKYLRESIQSILNQTHEKFEFIITVDGSSNNDLEIVNEYSKIDKRIIVIDNKCNKGLAYSLNNMISISSGEYVFRMDSDDISLPNRLEHTIAFMERNPGIDICGAQVRNLINGKVKHRKTCMPTRDKEIKTAMFFCNPLIHPTVTFRSKSIKTLKCQYAEGVKSEDYRMWVDCSRKGAVFGNIDKALLYYRKHQNQITSKDKDKLFQSGYETYSKLIHDTIETDSENEMRLMFEYTRSIRPFSSKEIVETSDFMKLLASKLDSDRDGEHERLFSRRFCEDFIKQAINGNKETTNIKITELSIAQPYLFSRIMIRVGKTIGLFA